MAKRRKRCLEDPEWGSVGDAAVEVVVELTVVSVVGAAGWVVRGAPARVASASVPTAGKEFRMSRASRATR